MAADSERPEAPRFWPRAISNSIWLSADRLVRGAFNLAVLIGIGRCLGPGLYGLYSYALAFVAVFAAGKAQKPPRARTDCRPVLRPIIIRGSTERSSRP